LGALENPVRRMSSSLAENAARSRGSTVQADACRMGKAAVNQRIAAQSPSLSRTAERLVGI